MQPSTLRRIFWVGLILAVVLWIAALLRPRPVEAPPNAAPAMGMPIVNESTPAPTPAPAPASGTAIASAGPLDADQSRFLGDLDARPYEQVTAPDVSPMLRWGLDLVRDITYTYRQETQAAGSLGASGSEPVLTTSIAGGDMIVACGGADRAQVKLEDVDVVNIIRHPASERPLKGTERRPPVVLLGLQPDGAIDLTQSPQNALLELLFPLPPTGLLKVGESADVPIEMPFLAAGAEVRLFGRMHITLARYVAVNGRTCAELKSAITLDRAEGPPQTRGQYHCDGKGASVSYFDTEDGCVDSENLALLLKVRLDLPMAGEEMGDAGKVRLMTLGSDALIQITRVR